MAKSIETIAHECGAAARKQAGPHPFDADGFSLVPTLPLDGDWTYLRDQLGREETDDEAEAFVDAWRAALNVPQHVSDHRRADDSRSPDTAT